jgi:hypothetical protein
MRWPDSDDRPIAHAPSVRQITEESHETARGLHKVGVIGKGRTRVRRADRASPDISPDRGMMARQDAARFAHPAPSQ